MAQAKHLLKKLKHAFGQDTLAGQRALVSGVQPQPRTRAVTEELQALIENLGVAVIDRTEEQLERDWYIHRGQKLIRQENWGQLSSEIRQFDEMRAITTGGSPISELLTRGARGEIVQPIRKSLSDHDTSPSTDGLGVYQAVADAHPKDYAISMIVAYTHIDAARVWQLYGPAADGPIVQKAKQHHFKIAASLLDPFEAKRLKAPALAAAKCAAIPVQSDSKGRLTKAFETLISLDPKTSIYLRNFGLNLLPGRHGSYEMLDLWALKAIEPTRSLWGTGAYAWMYLDALRHDAGAFTKIDLNLFMEAMFDILDRCRDQHTANLFTAFTALSLLQASPGHETLTGRRKRLQLNEAADWIIETQLREIHPLLWADAVPQGSAVTRDMGTEARKAVGEECALRVLTHRQREQGR